MSKATGFQLGDHRFLSPDENGPVSRLRKPKRQIKGASPPTVLEGVVKEAGPASTSARDLFKGRFCGHGEPTMAIFDVRIDGAELVEIACVRDPKDPGMKRNHPLIAVRKPGGSTWRVIFRREWEDRQATLDGVKPKGLTRTEKARLLVSPDKARVSVGFEYPCDAQSRDQVSWMTIDALFEGQKKPRCMIDAELA